MKINLWWLPDEPEQNPGKKLAKDLIKESEKQKSPCQNDISVASGKNFEGQRWARIIFLPLFASFFKNRTSPVKYFVKLAWVNWFYWVTESRLKLVTTRKKSRIFYHQQFIFAPYSRGILEIPNNLFKKARLYFHGFFIFDGRSFCFDLLVLSQQFELSSHLEEQVEY